MKSKKFQVAIIEDYLKKHEDRPVKFIELKKEFSFDPQELRIELNNLLENGKIISGSKGLLWIYSKPEHLKKMLQGAREL